MSPDTQAFYIQEGQKLSHGSVETFFSDHKMLIARIGDILNSWHETEPEGPGWMENVEPLTVKILLQSESLHSLLEEKTNLYHSSGEVSKIHDISSIYTLGRVQLEAYLTFFYLYVQPKTPVEYELRYLLFVIHSLTVRQQVDVKDPPHEIQQQYEVERQQIADYQKLIRQNTVFIGYTLQNQNRLINGQTAKEMGWEKIIKASTLNDSIKKTYDMYANHAHSEYMSLFQIKTLLQQPANAEFIFPVVIKNSLFVLSVFLLELVTLSGQQAAYDAFPLDFRRRVELWKGIITNDGERQEP